MLLKRLHPFDDQLLLKAVIKTSQNTTTQIHLTCSQASFTFQTQQHNLIFYFKTMMNFKIAVAFLTALVATTNAFAPATNHHGMAARVSNKKFTFRSSSPQFMSDDDNVSNKQYIDLDFYFFLKMAISFFLNDSIGFGSFCLETKFYSHTFSPPLLLIFSLYFNSKDGLHQNLQWLVVLV